MALTAEELAVKRENLAKLELVKLQLNSGKLAVRTVIDGNEVTYQSVNPGLLERHMDALRAEISVYDGAIAYPTTEYTVRNNRMF